MTDAQASPAGAVPESGAVVPDAEPGRSYMLVRVGNRWLGIEAHSVVEVAVKGAITRIPTAPRHVLGITSLRGGLVPVVSLAQLMGSTSSMSTDNGPIAPRLVVVATPEYELALVIHEVGGIVAGVPEKPKAPGNRRPVFLTDEMAWDGHTVEIVDVAALTTVAAGTGAYGD
jgi:chemotaxis signal transduction protein